MLLSYFRLRTRDELWGFVADAVLLPRFKLSRTLIMFTKPSKGNTNYGQRYFRMYVGILKDNRFKMKTITTPASRSLDMDVGAELLVSKVIKSRKPLTCPAPQTLIIVLYVL